MEERKEERTETLREAMERGLNEREAEEGAVENEPTAEETETMATETEATEAVPQENGEVTGEQPTQESPTVPEETVPQNPTVDMNAVLQQLMAQNQQLMAQNQQMQDAMKQQSQMAEQNVMNNFAPPIPPQAENPVVEEPAPVLDFASLRYMSEEEQATAMADWQKSIVDYAMQKAADAVRNEIAPMRDDYETKRKIAENDAAKATIYADPRFATFRERDADIERILASTPALNGADATTRYMLGGLIDRGLNNLQAKEMTTEELIQKALASPEVMKALETKRATEIQKQNANVPTIAPSSGTGNANPLPEQKPKSWEEVRNNARKRFGWH